MIRVVRSMKAMDSELQLRNWLRVVVQSCAYDRLRKEARQRSREESHAARGPVEPDPAMDERLRWLLNELFDSDSPGTRLLLMRYRLGWTLERIGHAVGLAPGAVDGRLRRATNDLREKASQTHEE